MENLEKTTGVEKISLYAVVILVSLFVCEFAFAARKAKGVTCVKDFIITYNYRVVPYIAIPVIMVLLISYFRRMYDDNRMVRYVNIRNFLHFCNWWGNWQDCIICSYSDRLDVYRRCCIDTWNY